MNVIELSAAESLLIQGEELLAMRYLEEALDLLVKAERQGAEADRCSAGRWTAKMLLGRFEEAWQESDAIRRRGAFDPHRFWQGEPLEGKRVMLRCLHGFGDAVQFLRYAPRLREVCSCLIVEVPPRLRELAACFDGVEEVITWGEAAPRCAPEWDVQVESIELPYLFRTQLSDLPVATSYLHLSRCSGEVAQAAACRREALQVGLVWTAGTWNPGRSVPFRKMQRMLDADDCEFWNLEGCAPPSADGLAGALGMREDDRARNDVMALARRVAQLDLLISVDTFAIHLAGALGVRAWLLLPYAADWRWLHQRDDSPWYPSLRLFRQPRPGDWESVIDAAREALCEWSGALTLQTERAGTR